jgi:VanZ family protein
MPTMSDTPLRPAWPWWLLAVAWMGVIFLLSAQPDLAFAPEAWKIEPVSLAAHFIEYMILAALLWQAVSRSGARGRRALAVAFALTVLYALSDEFHQMFVPGRVADVRDVLTDVTGALVALAILGRRGCHKQRG